MIIRQTGRTSLGSTLWESYRGGVDFYQYSGNLIAITEPIRKDDCKVIFEDTMEEKQLIAVSYGKACTSIFEVYDVVNKEA